MFTGIVEEIGTVRSITESSDGKRLQISTSFTDLTQGQSISVSGACLTVEAFGDDWFEVFLATETLDRTYLDSFTEGTVVNLERALPADGRFDGHVVQGHVDGTTQIQAIEQLGEDWEFRFELPRSLANYVVEKGSIAVDGISLTVAALDEQTFSVAIVPETYDLTTLSEKAVGAPVHLEVDVMAKYVEKLLDGYTE